MKRPLLLAGLVIPPSAGAQGEDPLHGLRRLYLASVGATRTIARAGRRWSGSAGPTPTSRRCARR